MDQGNIDDMFSQMLGELDDLTQQLDAVTNVRADQPPPPPPSSAQPIVFTAEPLDSHVSDFDEEDVDLTAMLDDLCMYEEKINQPDRGDDLSKETAFDARSQPQPTGGHSTLRQENETEFHIKEVLPPDVPVPPDVPEPPHPAPCTEVQKGGSGRCPVDPKVPDHVPILHKELSPEELEIISMESKDDQDKADKMRIALEKMKEARIQKLVVKVFNKDDSSKTMMIDERMTTRTIMKQLMEKNHFDFSPNWSLIEEMPSLYLERMFEEHEKPCDIMKHWTRDSTNQLRFVERKDKYALFKNPQHYLLTSSDQLDLMQERQKQTLIEEFFSDKGASPGVPEVEGYLHIKNGKSWSRKYCVLRSSGIYISKSGEPKKGKKLSDLTCLVMFEQTLLYTGRGWKKRFKSPYEYGFALKHPAIQMKSKHIRYLVCEDFKSFMRWTVGIRLAQVGVALLENYEKTNEEMKSTSTVSTAVRHEQADNLSLRSSDSGDSTRPGTIPRGGVKNIFEGAWQRADETDKSERSSNETLNRIRPKFKSSTKKSNNWWDLRDDDDNTSHSNTADSDSTSTSRSLDDLASAAVGGYQPPPSYDGAMPGNDTFPLPPPINYNIPPQLPPSKTAFYALDSTTFTSFDDPLPPPPPTQAPIGGGYKVPPPVPRKIIGGSIHRNYNNSNCAPPDDVPLPPPPTVGPGSAHIAPLSSYYMNDNGGESISKDDFPPPPPYLLDLKESIDAVTDSKKKSSDLPPPKPNKLINYIRRQALGRKKSGKGKPPPPPHRKR